MLIIRKPSSRVSRASIKYRSFLFRKVWVLISVGRPGTLTEACGFSQLLQMDSCKCTAESRYSGRARVRAALERNRGSVPGYARIVSLLCNV